MSVQDKIERTMKQIHVLFSEGTPVSGSPDKVIVDKTEVFPILEQLNLAIYEMMDEYEATTQARELARRRSEKEGQDMIDRISQQAEDVYAASLIYTDDALTQVQRLMAGAIESSRGIWERLYMDLEKEKRRVKEDQMELKEQLQDFKDSRKYMVIIEERNRERERLEKEPEKASDKKIKNEARHYPLNIIPEIKVNPSYFERRNRMAAHSSAVLQIAQNKEEFQSGMDHYDIPQTSIEDGEEDSAPMPFSSLEDTAPNQDSAAEDIPPMLDSAAEGIPLMPDSAAEDIPPMPENLEEEDVKPFVMPEIKVDLDAEYFKWRAETEGADGAGAEDGEQEGRPSKRRFLFGKK